MNWIGIIVQLIAGAVGGWGTAKAVKRVDLGSTIGNVIAGAIGGVGGTWLASLIPGLSGMLTSTAAAGGTDIGVLVSQAVASLVGGGVLTAIVGAIKNATMSKPA
jgi:hypothetical protein